MSRITREYLQNLKTETEWAARLKKIQDAADEITAKILIWASTNDEPNCEIVLDRSLCGMFSEIIAELGLRRFSEVRFDIKAMLWNQSKYYDIKTISYDSATNKSELVYMLFADWE
jgi:hypothetical protein